MPHLDSFRSLAEWPTHNTLIYIMYWLIDLLVCSCPSLLGVAWPCDPSRMGDHLFDRDGQDTLQAFPPIGYQGSDFCPKHSKRVDHNLWSFLYMSLFVQFLKRSLVGSVKPSRSQIALQVHVKSDMPSGFGGWELGIWDADLRKRDELIIYLSLLKGMGMTLAKQNHLIWECNGNVMGI